MGRQKSSRDWSFFDFPMWTKCSLSWHNIDETNVRSVMNDFRIFVFQAPKFNGVWLAMVHTGLWILFLDLSLIPCVFWTVALVASIQIGNTKTGYSQIFKSQYTKPQKTFSRMIFYLCNRNLVLREIDNQFDPVQPCNLCVTCP